MSHNPDRPRRRIHILDPRTPMAAAVNDHIAALQVKGYSPTTAANRSLTLAWLVTWLEDRGVTRPGEVTKPMLERYQRSLFHHRKPDGAPLSFRTQIGYLIAVKGFFRWLAQTNRILYNPASELELPRAEQRLPRVVLSVPEVEAVLAQPDITNPFGLRDRAIMEVFYSTGMRRFELTSLSVYDLDMASGTVSIREGKGRKDRVIPIGERAIAWVDRYLAEVRPHLVVPPDNHILFLTYEGNDFHPDRLTTVIRRYITAATGRSGSCHVFRHTMASLMLEGGADIRHIQEILGHADVSTTQVYTRVSIGHLKAVHAACHPGATNTRHRSPALRAVPSPTERSEGGDTTERSDGGSPLPDTTSGSDENACTSDDLLAALEQEQDEEDRYALPEPAGPIGGRRYGRPQRQRSTRRAQP